MGDEYCAEDSEDFRRIIGRGYIWSVIHLAALHGLAYGLDIFLSRISY
jgi:hypothetical protein